MLHWPAGWQDRGSHVLPQGDEALVCGTPRFPALNVGLIQRRYWRALSPEIRLNSFLEVFPCSVFSHGCMSRIRGFVISCWPWFYSIHAHQPNSCPLQRGWEAEAGVGKHLKRGWYQWKTKILLHDSVGLFLFSCSERSCISLGNLNPRRREQAQYVIIFIILKWELIICFGVLLFLTQWAF